MKENDKFVVAVKDTSSGKILPGKVLGKYRQREFADRDRHDLAKREGCQSWQVGIWHKGKLLN